VSIGKQGVIVTSPSSYSVSSPLVSTVVKNQPAYQANSAAENASIAAAKAALSTAAKTQDSAFLRLAKAKGVI
jgi:hypothetical protein